MTNNQSGKTLMSKIIDLLKDTENFTIAMFLVYVIVLTHVALFMLMQMVL